MDRPARGCGIMSGLVILSTSVRRAEASFCRPEGGQWCCSARESGRRPSWQCCTRWQRQGRRGRSYGCTQLGIGSINPFGAEVRRLMLSLPYGRRYICYSRPGSLDKVGEDFNGAGHFSRLVFDEAEVSREADVYL